MFISSDSLKPSLLAVATSALILTGCGGDSSSNDDGETGKVSMSVTDAPVNSALGVYVQFSGVVLIKDDETQEELTFDEPKQINLLDYQAGNSVELFTDFEVEAGEYSQIRLMVDTEGNNDTYISFADGSFELEIPSGEQTGLKLVSGFTVTADESVSFMLDFDLRKAITVTGNGEYKLRPTIDLFADFTFAFGVGAHGAIGQYKARDAVVAELADHVQYPAVVGVAGGRGFVTGPARVVGEFIRAAPLFQVERRVGDDKVGF